MDENAEMAAAAPVQPTRPAVITLVGIVLYIWAAMAALEAVALFLNRDNDVWKATYGTTDEITIVAVASAVLALLLFAVASGILSGTRWARIAVAIVVGLRLAALSWFMLSHLGGGAFTWSTVLSLALGLFVLWALYGKDESVTYFDGYY
jgi:O-antigen/teichoic acid export membrane protein